MKKKQKLVVANWKMNPLSLSEAKAVFKGIKKASSKLKRVKTVVCPPFVYLSEIAKLAKGEVGVGSQTISAERSGSKTGEVSAVQVSDAGARYSIIGHSERRAMGETDELVSRKLAQALGEGLIPIVCVGESVRDEEARYLEFLGEQVRGSLSGLSKKDIGKIVIAYEPVWAIGKSDADAPAGKDVYETTLYVRKVLAEAFGKDNAFSVPILYGGSVTFRNASDIVRGGEVDGLLVGRQSLEPEGFAEVLSLVDSIK